MMNRHRAAFFIKFLIWPKKRQKGPKMPIQSAAVEIVNAFRTLLHSPRYAPQIQPLPTLALWLSILPASKFHTRKWHTSEPGGIFRVNYFISHLLRRQLRLLLLKHSKVKIVLREFSSNFQQSGVLI